MTNTIYAKKLGMTEAYLGDKRTSVTVLKIMPLSVSHHKTVAKDGYAKTQVVFGDSPKKVAKAIKGHLQKSKAKGQYLREIDDHSSLELGTVLDFDQLIIAGTSIDITAKSKGKGIAGVVKRWGFAGGPRTHGQSDRLRRAGSIGQGTTPGRVFKGKKMSGRMGNDQVTIKNTFVVSYNNTSNHLLVAGSVPGHTGNLVRITKVADTPQDFPKVTLTKNQILPTTTLDQTNKEQGKTV